MRKIHYHLDSIEIDLGESPPEIECALAHIDAIRVFLS